jgi:adenine-specific DNA-methyltransferase
MEKNIYELVEEKLRVNKEYVSDDGNLLKAKIYADVMSMNSELIKTLLSDENIKKVFFSTVDNVEVFDKQKFAWFVESKEFLPDSYTKYTNKVGLTINDKYLEKIDDVVLDFPYKDCVLEGGQTREDQKRQEIFYNEIIGHNQITNMLSPKVFTNSKRYSANGVENNVTFENKDNLIIKGNNLIGISSLLKKYEGKVRLIYIDPPYNTSTDSFKYNDTFNHSTWLTFMKTRLEIAKRLLSEDGSIYVQMDNKEAHYLKILMDEVFGRNNFRSEIIWDTSIPYVAGNKWLSNNWIYSYASIFYYAKNKEKVFFHKLTFDVQQKSGDISHKPYKDVWSDIENFAGFLGAKDLKVDFNSRKPEKLIERILEASSEEGDLILDFFGGSGTTLAVAHKMKRQYIGIEQMDDQMNIIVDRLCKVISGEDNKGISKQVNWQSGGSFVYCELKENAQDLITAIQKSTDKEIDKLKNKIYEDNRIVPYITKQELQSTDAMFNNLELDDKKKVLINLVDKNKLYVNYSDINDIDYKINDPDKKFTNSFYNGGQDE